MWRNLAVALLSLGAVHGDTGSQVCAACHEDIVRTYRQTGMAQSSGRVSGIGREGQFTTKSAVHYRVYADKGKAFVGFDLGEAHGSRELQYFIGSGAVGKTFLYSFGDYLYEAPISWYAAESRWDLSPGYEQYDRLVLTRPVQLRCLQCHSSQVQPRAGTVNGYGAPPFLEGGVSCERCHGDAGEHVSHGGRMVNPVKLPPDRRDSICEQCHLTGAARVARLGNSGQFSAGGRLSDYSVIFVWSGGEPDLRVTSHFETLALSKCKLASGDRLWCGSCHDPHRAPAEQEKASYYRAQCQGCHEQAQCQRGPDCAGCHMPKSAVLNVPHASYTDHTIRVPGPAAKPQNRGSGARTLVPFDARGVGDRELGLAYTQVQGFEKQSLEYLERAPERDPEVLAQLAFLYDSRGDEQKAIPLYTKALKDDPSQVTAAANLATLHMRHGEFREAIGLWQQALAGNPGLENARLSLAMAQYQTGDRAGAESTLNQLLEMNPGAETARRFLRSMTTGH